jgi:phosphoglycolate phosphatase-like HAD superfamily hydrolase
MRDPRELAEPGRALIWDLDGTIADTRIDIATGVVEMLRELGRPPLELSQVIRHVGHGVKMLVAGCLTETGQPARDAGEIDRGVEIFRACYWRHLMDTTAPFPGIPEILHALAARGRPMAIVSNKPQDATREILRRMGLLDCFRIALGGDSLTVRKPDPAPLWHALRLCLATDETAAPAPVRAPGRGAVPEQTTVAMPGTTAEPFDEAAPEALRKIASRRAAMIGDSPPDVLAARAAGMPACGVAWGFDPDGEMRRADLDWWFESVRELGNALLGG